MHTHTGRVRADVTVLYVRWKDNRSKPRKMRKALKCARTTWRRWRWLQRRRFRSHLRDRKTTNFDAEISCIWASRTSRTHCQPIRKLCACGGARACASRLFLLWCKINARDKLFIPTIGIGHRPAQWIQCAILYLCMMVNFNIANTLPLGITNCTTKFDF